MKTALLNMTVGFVTVIAGQCVCRWTEHSWEVGTFGVVLQDIRETLAALGA